MQKIKLIVCFFILTFFTFSQGRDETGIFIYDKQKAGKKIRYNFNYIEGFSDIVDTFMIANRNVFIEISDEGCACERYVFTVGTHDRIKNNEYRPYLKSSKRYYQPLGSRKKIPIILQFDNKFTELNNSCCMAANFYIYVDLDRKVKVVKSNYYPN